jgi:hypothetical protein
MRSPYTAREATRLAHQARTLRRSPMRLGGKTPSGKFLVCTIPGFPGEPARNTAVDMRTALSRMPRTGPCPGVGGGSAARPRRRWC